MANARDHLALKNSLVALNELSPDFCKAQGHLLQDSCMDKLQDIYEIIDGYP